MNIISLEDASKTLADAPLWEHVTLGIETGEKTGFVGPNGSGKSTFLRLLSGDLEPDTGTIARNRGCAIVTVNQRPSFDPDHTLDQFLYDSAAPIVALVAEFKRLSERHDHSDASHDRLKQVTARMEESGGFDMERRFASYLTELDLGRATSKMGEFSGGMIRKAALARAFASSPDLLLLDEPTNHLDIDTIEWLETRLKEARFAFVSVTHDRFFLDSVCDTIMEIDEGRVFKYPGDYSEYLKRKRDRAETAERSAGKRENILRVELEWLQRGPKARAGKSKSRKQRIEGLVAQRTAGSASMDGFSQAETRLGKKVLEFESATAAYGAKAVLKPFSFAFTKGERVGIIGPNGSGKTTLLNLASGAHAPASGQVIRGETVKFAVFDQLAAGLESDLTVLEYLQEHAERISMKDGASLSAEQFLERFLFPRSSFSRKVRLLSGGERRRLQLLRILASNPNFLVLDEPTNDFDIDTISLLEDFLEGFQGCVLAVSHDRAFLDALADKLLAVAPDGTVTETVGGYSDWRELRDTQTAAAQALKNAEPKRSERVMRTETKKKLSFKERAEFESLLPALEALETEKSALEATFAEAGKNPQAVIDAHKRYDMVSREIEEKTSRWEELAEREQGT